MKASATSLMSSSSAAKRCALLALSSATRGSRPASPLPANKAAADVGLRSSGAAAILAPIDDRGGLRVASHGPKLPDNLETDLFLLEAFAGLDVGPFFSGSILPRRNKNIFRRGPRRLPCKRVWVPRSASTTHAYLPCDCTRTWDLFRCEFGT
ncbi:hypothetical protein BHM03_00042640 [Ensete ventricosum]|nr:hypothetical protein BHM03_00042640 [Ensete ventricosum]